MSATPRLYLYLSPPADCFQDRFAVNAYFKRYQFPRSGCYEPKLIPPHLGEQHNFPWVGGLVYGNSQHPTFSQCRLSEPSQNEHSIVPTSPQSQQSQTRSHLPHIIIHLPFETRPSYRDSALPPAPSTTRAHAWTENLPLQIQPRTSIPLPKDHRPRAPRMQSQQASVGG